MTDPKSWKAQIAALGTIPHASSNPFVNKIEEFVDALNANPVVRARMTRRQTPTSQILSLRTSPKWIRDRDSTLLYIDVRRTEAFVLRHAAENDLRFEAPDELLTYLVNFATKESFLPALVDEYKSVAEAPVECWLRAEDTGVLSLFDVRLKISNEQQRKLVESARSATQISFQAEILPPLNAGFMKYSAHQAYAAFESGGFAIRPVEHMADDNGDVVQIVGVPSPPDDGVYI